MDALCILVGTWGSTARCGSSKQANEDESNALFLQLRHHQQDLSSLGHLFSLLELELSFITAAEDVRMSCADRPRNAISDSRAKCQYRQYHQPAGRETKLKRLWTLASEFSLNHFNPRKSWPKICLSFSFIHLLMLSRYSHNISVMPVCIHISLQSECFLVCGITSYRIDFSCTLHREILPGLRHHRGISSGKQKRSVLPSICKSQQVSHRLTL